MLFSQFLLQHGQPEPKNIESESTYYFPCFLHINVTVPKCLLVEFISNSYLSLYINNNWFLKYSFLFIADFIFGACPCIKLSGVTETIPNLSLYISKKKQLR